MSGFANELEPVTRIPNQSSRSIPSVFPQSEWGAGVSREKYGTQDKHSPKETGQCVPPKSA